MAIVPYYFGGQTLITELDVSDPSAMKVLGTLTVNGAFVDGRLNGSTARLVINSTPLALAQRARIGSAGAWVPAVRFRSRVDHTHFRRTIAPCAAIMRPAVFSGLGMLSILTIDLTRGLDAYQSQSLMADARVVYGSANNLYVATDKWINPATPIDDLPQSQTTVIDQFDVTNPDRTTLLASGEVPGYVLNQYSLSEFGGYLRVASTSEPVWWGTGPANSPPSQSYVSVLADQGGTLAVVGQVAGLGMGQRIYSVRFLGNVGYVVTFRRVDPLYTLDLSNPALPRVAGKLELEGYSSYLQPVGQGLLLGIGADVGSNNEPFGGRLDLFDVTNPASPTLIGNTSLGLGSSSAAQYDPHAFLFWAPTGLAVLPVEIYPVTCPPPVPAGPPMGAARPPVLCGTAVGSGGSRGSGPYSQPFTGALAFHVDASGITSIAQIAQDQIDGSSPPILRSVVAGNDLYTISDAGVMASDLSTLARLSFLQFPQQHPVPVLAAPSQPVAP